jgi:uncharacterized protein
MAVPLPDPTGPDPTRPGPTRAFLGVGWAFPPRLDPSGGVALAAYEEDIAQAIRIIALTNPGERVMRPTFGAGLDSFVFEPVSATTLALVQTRVRDALIDWEPRIDVDEVIVTAPATADRLVIEVRYRVRATNSLHNLVFPYYLSEGTPR